MEISPWAGAAPWERGAFILALCLCLKRYLALPQSDTEGRLKRKLGDAEKTLCRPHPGRRRS